MEEAKTQERKPDIRKAGLVIIRDRKLLLSRSHGKDVFVAPGGKLEVGESSVAAAIREIAEEQGLTITADMLEKFGTYLADAAGSEADPKLLEMVVYLLHGYHGQPEPHQEIAENLWYDTSLTDVKQGSIFEHHVIPELVRRGLID